MKIAEKENTDKIKSQPFYLPELDILRFFAFFAVFFHHSFPLNPESYQGKLAPFSQWIASIVSAGGFGVDLMKKDLGLAVDAARSVNLPLPLGGQALQLYQFISQASNGGKDFSFVYEYLRQLADANTPKQK